MRILKALLKTCMNSWKIQKADFCGIGKSNWTFIFVANDSFLLLTILTKNLRQLISLIAVAKRQRYNCLKAVLN